MKPDNDYRFADAWVGVFLGTFIGAVLAAAIVFGEFGEEALSPLFIVGASIGSAAVVGGSLGLVFGKRFTDTVETWIKLIRTYFHNQQP